MHARLSLFATSFVALVPVVRAQAPCHVENDGPNYNDAPLLGPSALVAIKFTPTASFHATALEVFTGERTGPNTLAIWSDLVDQPNNALAGGSWNMSTTDSWQGAPLANAVALVAGQDYWIVWGYQSGAQPSLDLPTGAPGQEYRGSFDNGQTWNGPFQFPSSRWKFRVWGDCVGSTSYCTPGTTTHGCTAVISSSGNPSASATSGFTLSLGFVEGQKQGLIFYGTSGALALPWGTGSTSFLCVKPPTQRMNVQSSGGNSGFCDGALSTDWLAFVASHPGALGLPLAAGTTVQAQGWFRDPSAVKSTNLSDALTFVVSP